MRAASEPQSPASGSALNGAKKAALLLLAIDRPLAGQVLKHFTAEELRLIPRYAADMERISSSEFEKLVEEFGREFAEGMNFTGSTQEVEELIAGSLTPEHLAQMNPGSAPAAIAREPAWNKLSALPEQVIGPYLAAEHPQVAAVVLSRLAPDAAARIMALYPAEQRHGIIGRMLAMKDTNDEVAIIIEQVMASDLLASGVKAAASPSEGRNRVANIINKFEDSDVEETLSGLAQSNPEEVKALKGLLFGFPDLPRLTQAGRTALLDKIPTDRLVLALNGTDAAFQTIALSSLAARARRMVEAELSGGQSPPQRDVKAAQRAIADLALAMAARGELDLNPPDAGAGNAPGA